ncbi:hypothetical protein [Aminobacter sp. AP02]|uniref:hypothetical protein n=1 Tax=Aminobacter sp. AP02 TaxID=2135737 RepID=UPI000D7B33AF|nr:hypothetical protein [Aminobacter sp. AP02]PWK72659.1 hypothetical protein C8K44_105100 [Aminobacter sp. AP02]
MLRQLEVAPASPMRDVVPGGFDMVGEKIAKGGLALVFTTLLLDVIGFGIIMPVLPSFLQMAQDKRHA